MDAFPSTPKDGASGCAVREGHLPDHRGQAFKLIASARSADALEAAVALIAEHDPALRGALIERYEYLAAEPKRRDPGTYIRSALLRALRPVALRADLPLLERAATTYEVGSYEVAGLLRAAALVAMAEIDPTLAAFHAARLLADPQVAQMSGQPALTAIGVLAAQNETLALYAYLGAPGDRLAEIVAECIRSMAQAPEIVVTDLVKRFGDDRHLVELSATYGDNYCAVLLLGLFDLVLGRPDADRHRAFLMHFLRSYDLMEVCGYLATAIVAGRNEALITTLRDVRPELNGERGALVDEALSLLGPERG